MPVPSFLDRRNWSRWVAAQSRSRVRRWAGHDLRPSGPLEGRTLLSNVVVSNTNDSGAGSLRQAILNAPSGSTITFAHKLEGQTITLTSGVLAIGDNLTINGLGASNLTVSGGGASEVFSVATGAAVTISGLTISGGMSDIFGDGGGISNAGTLNLDNVVVTGNQAAGSFTEGGGIYNTGSLTLNHSAVIDNQSNSNFSLAAGGGIENVTGAVLTVNSSTISGNLAVSADGPTQGGAIDNQFGAKLSISGSTVSDNQAIGASGFIGNDAQGGAINDEGAMIITGSALSGNQAVGGSSGIDGGVATGGAIDMTGVTVNDVFGARHPDHDGQFRERQPVRGRSHHTGGF